MSIASSTIKNKKKVVCYIPISNQFENIKPVEVKCFPDDTQTTPEIEKQQTDVTATIVTTVPQRKRPISAPTKKQTVTPVMDMIVTKPIRHLAILPSSKERPIKEIPRHATNLSETFTMYDGPTTTPVVGRSLNDTVTIKRTLRTRRFNKLEQCPTVGNISLLDKDILNDFYFSNQYQMSDLHCEMPINIELNNDDTNLCDNTTISSVCELIDQPKLKQKPHSLIGRYQLPHAESSSKVIPSVHIATIHYGDIQPPEPANKQILIQQFYNQLEKMKATFNNEQSEPPRQVTTNTLTFDNGQVTQILATNQLKEKTTVPRVSSATVKLNDKKPPVLKKQRTTKNPSSRIQSAPVTMSIRSKTDIKCNSKSSCKEHRNEKIPIQQKKSIPIKEKQTRRIESAPPNRIDIHGPEVTLLPQDEEECRQMYEKLQRLQPNGACADLNTLRRALYPPIGTTSYSANPNHEQTSAFKSYRQRTEEMPQSWVKVNDKYVPKQQSKSEVNSYDPNVIIALDNTNIDRIADQVKKHAAINYSYYTRTK